MEKTCKFVKVGLYRAHVNDMTIYEMLLDAALKSIRGDYVRRVNDELDSRADAVLPTADSQITEETEFELVTWLVVGR